MPETVDFNWSEFWAGMAVSGEALTEAPDETLRFFVHLSALDADDATDRLQRDIVLMSDEALGWTYGALLEAYNGLAHDREPPAPDLVLDAVDALGSRIREEMDGRERAA